MAKLTQDQFINRSKEIHKNKYDYSKVNYINTNTKVKIICKTHNEFEQTPKGHLKGFGCKACAMEYVQNNNRKTQEQIVQEFNKVHSNKYDYSKVNYVDDKTKIIIICNKHGEFEQSPTSHKQGCGCPKCGKLDASEKRIIPFEKFVQNAIIIHGSKFTYFKNEYKTYKKNTLIKCNDCKLMFSTSPQHHAGPEGTGCPNCAISGFNRNKPAILYYLKITTDTNQVLYKIGITNRTVNERFNLTDLSKIEIVKQKLYDNGQDALDWETKLKRMYKEYQYKGPDILSSGNTELFTEDIIAMWDSN